MRTLKSIAIVLLLCATLPSLPYRQDTGGGAEVHASDSICGEWLTFYGCSGGSGCAFRLCSSGEVFLADMAYCWAAGHYGFERLYNYSLSYDSPFCTNEFGDVTGRINLPDPWASLDRLNSCGDCAPAAQISFYADRTTITKGECTTLRWDVDNVQAIYFEGQGATGHETRQVCPTTTTTYWLRVVTYQGEDNRSVTINVQVPKVDNAQLVSISQPTTAFDPRSSVAVGCRMRNTGTTTWGASYTWIRVGGDALGAPASKPLKSGVAPGNETSLDLTFTLPSSPGEYRSQWRIANAQGKPFGDTATFVVTVRQKRPAQVTLEDFTLANTLTDYNILETPTLWQKIGLWMKVSNKGEVVFNPPGNGGNYTVLVFLKERSTGRILQSYEYQSGHYSLILLPSLAPGESISLLVNDLTFMTADEDGEVEITFMPDPGLDQKASNRTKPVTIKPRTGEVLDCAGTIVGAIIDLLPPAWAAKTGVVGTCIAASAVSCQKAYCLGPKVGACLLQFAPGESSEAAQLLLGAVGDVKTEDPACIVFVDSLTAYLEQLLFQGKFVPN